MCEEEGEKKGQEVFGEFGGQIGKEAAVVAGRKAGLAKAVELLLEGGLELARTSGGEAGLISVALLEFSIASTNFGSENRAYLEFDVGRIVPWGQSYES